MRSEWEYVKLEDAVGRGSSNISLNKVKDDTGEYSLYGAKGLMKTISFYDQDKPYLAIIKDGAGVGRVSSHPGKSSVLATMQYLIPKNGYNINFVEYFLNSISFDDFKTGSTIPHIYFKDYKCVKIPKLPEAEQKEIVRILDSAFARIDAALANVRQNIINADELFQSKLTQIFSNPDPSWQSQTINDVCDVVNGGTPKTSDKSLWDGEFAWITPAEMGKVPTPFVKTTKRTLTQEGLSGSSAKLVAENSVILSSRAPIGHLVINQVPMAFNQGCKGIVPGRQINFKLLYYYLLLSRVKLDSLGSGTTFKELSSTKLKAFSIPVPPIEKQHKMVLLLDKMSDSSKALCKKYKTEEAALLELKKSLLQKAFTGNLTNNVI